MSAISSITKLTCRDACNIAPQNLAPLQVFRAVQQLIIVKDLPYDLDDILRETGDRWEMLGQMPWVTKLDIGVVQVLLAASTNNYTSLLKGVQLMVQLVSVRLSFLFDAMAGDLVDVFGRVAEMTSSSSFAHMRELDIKCHF